MALKVDVRPRERTKILGNWYAAHSGAGHGDAPPDRTDQDAQRQAEAQRSALFYEYDGT